MSNRIIAGICLAGLLTCGVCLLAGAPSQSSPARVSTLYDRIGAKLEANPELAKVVGQPTKELQGARWMVGTWAVTARVFKTPKSPERIDRGDGSVREILGGTWFQLEDSYGSDPDDLGFLTFDTASKRWVSVGIDKTGNAIVSTAEGWDGNRLELVAEKAEILGEHVVLRQTIEKRSDREYHVLNEERLDDGSWAAIDEYTYVKK